MFYEERWINGVLCSRSNPEASFTPKTYAHLNQRLFQALNEHHSLKRALECATSKDWPEDFGHENGRYSCKCSSCNGLFVGHKRRTLCKTC